MSHPDHPDKRFLDEAIRLAHISVDDGGGPFGAVVARNGEIIGRGTNRVAQSLDPTAHAEVVAIREACRKVGSFRLDGCEIYASCEPCPMCLGAIYWSRMDRVVYAASREDAADAGFDDAWLYEELAKPPQQRALKMIDLARAEAWPAFAAWREKPDKVEY